MKTLCTTDGCRNRTVARGLCLRHYKQQRYRGAFEPVKPAPKSGKLQFMGQEFDNREQLVKAFPAFAGEDAIRAIRAGATTPMEVEIASWRDRNKILIRQRKAQKRNAKAGGLAKYSKAKRSTAA